MKTATAVEIDIFTIQIFNLLMLIKHWQQIALSYTCKNQFFLKMGTIFSTICLVQLILWVVQQTFFSSLHKKTPMKYDRLSIITWFWNIVPESFFENQNLTWPKQNRLHCCKTGMRYFNQSRNLDQRHL